MALICSLLTLAGLLISYVAFQSGIFAICTDCISRLYFAYNWSHTLNIYQVISWLPLHSMLYGLFLKLGHAPLLTAHVLTALFSALVIGLSGLIVFRLTRSDLATVLAMLFTAISPLRVWLSFSMLSEPAFTCLFLLLILTLTEWLNRERRIYVWVAILLSMLLCLHRYAAWPVSALLGAFIVYKKRSFSSVFLLALCLAVPLIWLGVMYVYSGDVFHAFHYYKADSDMFYANSKLSNGFAVVTLIKYFPVVLAMYPMMMIYRNLLNSGLKVFAVCSACLFCMEWFMIWNQVPTVFPERSIYLSGLMLLLSSAMAMAELWKRSIKLKPYLVVTVLAGLLLQTYFGLKIVPNYDTETAMLARKISHLPWHSKTNLMIGHDLQEVRAMTMTLFSDHPDQFVPVQINQTSGEVSVPKNSAMPNFFVVQSDILANKIQRAWTHSTKIRKNGLWLIAKDEFLIQQILTW